MESEQFNPHEVISRRNARGYIEVIPPAVLNHSVNGPLSSAGVEAVFRNLEPLEARVCSGSGSIVNLGT